VHEEVVRHARFAEKQKRSEITVQLEPPELGRMKVVIAREEGKLNVHINVENPEFRNALRGELPELERSLRESHGWSGKTDVSDFDHGEGRQDQAPSEQRRTTDSLRNTAQSGGRRIDEAGTRDFFGEQREIDWLV